MEWIISFVQLFAFLILAGLAGYGVSEKRFGIAVFTGFLALAMLIAVMAQVFLYELAQLQ